MPIGPSLRRLLGPAEPRVASAYRRFFIDLPRLAQTLQRLAPAESVLEIGAGDGLLAMELCAAPKPLRYLGIDVAPTVGRLFSDDRGSVAFRAVPLSALDPSLSFDLVVFADVLHHVAPTERRDLIELAWSHVRPGGSLAIKEWERRPNVPHLLAFASDRYVSGDRGVSFLNETELSRLVADCVDGAAGIVHARIPPRRNNILMVVTRAPADHQGGAAGS